MMDKYGYDGPVQFKPLSPWTYFWLTVLYSIPLIGLIFLIVFSVDSSNINRRKHARSYWCVYVIVLILLAVLIFSGAIVFPTIFGIFR